MDQEIAEERLYDEITDVIDDAVLNHFELSTYQRSRLVEALNSEHLKLAIEEIAETIISVVPYRRAG